MDGSRTCQRVSCGRPIRNRRPDARYCSDSCRRLYWREANNSVYRVNISATANGARAEMLAAASLIEDGYEVFRALDPGASCDLIALKDGEVLRVEVRTAMRSVNGSHVADTRGEYDLLLTVYGQEIGRQ